jgi:hypothetical protein
MWSKKWYLKRNISCDVHLLSELLETDVPWDDAIVVSAGKLRKLWDSLSELRSLCVKDDWKGEVWGLRYCLSKPRSLLSFPSGMTSHSKISQFNWQCIAPLRLSRNGITVLTFLLLFLRLPWLRFCKANARVKLAKTGHGQHSSRFVVCVVLFVIRVVLLLIVLFCVLFVCKCVLYCTVLLPPGVNNPIAVDKYIILYNHIISYHIW